MKYAVPKNHNIVLKGDGETVGDLHAYGYVYDQNHTCYVSIWYPSEKERLAIMMGLPIQVHVITPGPIPAIAVDVSKELDVVTSGIKDEV